MRRVWRLAVTHPLVSLLLAGALVGAAIVVTYSNTSTLTTSVTPPPVQYVAGDDAGPSALTDYVSAYTISTNKTFITTTVKGVPEASLSIGSFFKLTNVDDASHTATLTTSQVSNAFVSTYTIEIYNSADVLQGTLDLTATTPSASVTIPTTETFYATLTLTLATGAGANNVALSNAITLSVSS